LRQMAKPEGPSPCIGYCSFVEERGSSGETRRAEPTSPFLVASDQKRQILCPIVSPQGVFKGTNMSYCRRCPLSSHSFPGNRITKFSCADTVCNGSKIAKNDRFLKNRKLKYGGNMRNRFFDHGFLFDFYSDRAVYGDSCPF